MATDIRTMVVIASDQSPVSNLTNEEVRRLYLGSGVTLDNIILRPLLNNSDPYIERVFLQKIIFMSKHSFERRLLSNTFRRGWRRPQLFTEFDLLIDELKSSPETLTIIWKDQLKDKDGIKLLGELWTGTIE